ncbi:hypothetical protein CEW92_13650 [Bacillaceae bacterium SAS-127]|nr:hypothetical protein CEW92_13650 [Bacillaceae bacterium SAS-127]
MIEKNERSLRFEVAFNRIHQQLKQLVPKQAQHSFIEILHTSAQQHAVVRTHLDELKQFAKLRNAIVHQKTEAHSYIAEPHEEIVKRIEQIDALIAKPADALSIASKPVRTVELHTSLTEVLQMIKQFSYSEYPVFTKGGCKGLLTGKDILKWMAHQQIDGSPTLFDVTVQDLLTEQSTSTLAFIKKEANIFDVEYLFESYQQSNKKLEALLITPMVRRKNFPLR